MPTPWSEIPDTDGPNATNEQQDYIWGLAEQLNLGEAELMEMAESEAETIDQLTRSEASALLDKLIERRTEERKWTR